MSPSRTSSAAPARRRFVSESKLAVIIDRSTKSLSNDRRRGTGLPHYRVGKAKSIRYDLDEVLELIERTRSIPRN